MARSHPNHPQSNTEQSHHGKKNGIADLYTHEIVDAFSKQMESKHDDYSSRSKEQIVKDFEQFVEQEYGNHILHSLKDGKITGKPLDIEMNLIADKGFTLSDFLDSKKGEVIQNNLRRTVKEQDAMEHGLLSLYNQRNRLPPTTKSKLVFDDFIHAQGYRKITNPSGDVTGITPGHNPKSHNIQTLQTAWKEYVRSVTSDSNERQDYTALLDLGHFDSTEKIVAVSAVRELYENIQRKMKGQQRQDLLSLADSIFEKSTNPIPSDLTWTTMEGLAVAMRDFFQQAGSVAGQDQLQSLQDMRLSLKSCVKIAEENKLLEGGSAERQLFNKKYSDVNRQFQNMANSFVQADLINNIDEIVETVDEEIDEYAKVFDIPGNMNKFFEQFGKPSELTNTYTDPAYITLKRREHDLRELLAKQGISKSDKESYTAELVEVKGKINAHKNTHQVSTWDGYFDHIAQQIDTAHAQTGIAVSGSDVKGVLQDLRDSNWDIASLGSGQNTLMQASIALQLLNIKNKHSFQNLGYSFQSYAQFVSSLYDLESPKATILTQDNVPIELNFTSKKFVGKPLEFHNIDVDDISSLSNIRVEFELDLHNNPDAENFIRTMTGGPNSHLVQDFFPQQPGFPETMTDSSLVEMIDKNGVRYEGYLSPTDLVTTGETDNIYGSDPLIAAKTFILYSKPADQLHTDRNFVTQKDIHDNTILTESGKEKPVYINSSNLADWQSIDIKEKKVTLSDGHLKALTLGHMVAQSVDASQLLDPKNSQHVQNMIAQQDASIAQELQENNRDIGSEGSQHIETPYESLSSAEEFSQSWESLLGGKHPCEVGSRIAVKFPQEIDGFQTLQTHPVSEQLLSMTIKDLKKDEQGNIIGATFAFDTLSRIGKCTLKDITLEGKKIDKIGEIFKGGATYIDNINDPQDYSHTISRLQSQFSDGKRKKDYLWSNIGQLDFDGKVFKKGKESVTRFLTTEKAADSKNQKEKKFDVEYKVESLGGGKYRVTSSPYSTDVVDKDNKTKKENISFDTTTDMAGMLLILANKNLVPYTDKEYQEYKNTSHTDTNLVPQKERKRYTFNVWKSVLQGKFKDVVGAIKKKIGPEEEDELRFALFNEANLLGRVSKGWIGKTLDVFGLNVIEDMADEAAAEGMQYGRKKIDGVFQYLSKFHAAYNVNAPAGMAMVKGMIDDAMSSYPNIPMKKRWTAAGALLYTIDKMKNGYGKLTNYPVGTYVKILFGPQYYDSFMVRYKALEVQAQAPGAAGQDAQERLSMLEYNYIISNVRGGDTLEKEMGYILSPEKEKANIFYFQNLYSRKFANELGTALGKMKSYSFNPESDAVKGFVDTNNFEHIYNECKGHMADMRVEDCLQELIALQKMAKNTKDANRVDQLFMTGILSGVFVHNLSKDNKKLLAKLMRNSSIPYAKMVTQFDAPKRLQAMLSLATGGKFDNWTYGKDKKIYNPNDIAPTANQSNKKDIIDSFETWFDENRDQVISFLHMDPESMKTDDNMVHVWKSEDPNLKIFGKKVDPTTKMYVHDILQDFYVDGRGRGVNIDYLNDDSGLKHMATMDENFYPSINQYKDGGWDLKTLDYAELARSNLNDQAPSGKESPANKYRLMQNINNFFRFFNGIGSINYNRQPIEQFYKYMRLAKERTNNEHDRARLIWFALTKKLYDKGAVPDDVIHVFKKYMKYFEDNLDNFDVTLGSIHMVPSGGDNFGYIFEENLNSLEYIPDSQRRKIPPKEQNNYARTLQNQGRDVLNRSMDNDNLKQRTGGGGFMGNNERAIGKSVDDKIMELRGGKKIISKQEENYQRTQAVDTENRDKVDLSTISSLPNTPITTNNSGRVQGNTGDDDVRDQLEEMRELMGL